ncbi:hypothetical protein LQ26_004174 [Salmonella enterica subsp. enterica]|nr:hypothetical protein [Salmonella enterica subsp. enterica]
MSVYPLLFSSECPLETSPNRAGSSQPCHSCLPACSWLPPAASVPRPAGHGTGVFIAQARRRCDFTPCPCQFKARPSSRFRGISWPSNN